MRQRLLNRRQFGARCAAFSLTFPVLSTLARQPAEQKTETGVASQTTARTVRLPDGTKVPAVGQGCWHLGQAPLQPGP